MSAARIESLSGAELRDLFAAATIWLERNVPQVNAVNVFPVHDGDTGTNMHYTMRKAVEAAESAGDTSAGTVLDAISRGAFYEAKGNSGVILSQILRGFASEVGGAKVVSPQLFASSLERASLTAYEALPDSVEGTILTVIREVSVAVRQAASDGADMTALMETAVDAATASVEKTPLLLPKLAEAGVVDAGGLGLRLILEGMLAHLRGETLDEASIATAATVSEDWLNTAGTSHQTESSLYGYCTELLIGGSGLDLEAIRGRITELGDSVIVVGEPALVRVHVHTDDPGAAVSLGTSAGQLVQVKVDNIRKQAERFVEMHEQRRDDGDKAVEMQEQRRADGDKADEEVAPVLSTVAVVAGEGMARVFESFGCTRTISGGPTMNPSTREIVEAVDACPSDDVAVLPNDKNIILAARQARDLTHKRLHVIATRSMPQGITAILAINASETDATANAKAMEEACRNVRTIGVTRAERSTSVKGVKVSKGEVIAIVDDELTLAAASTEEAVMQALEGLAGHGTAVALYYGGESDEIAAQALARNIRERFSSYQVEVVFGGQPHYDYIVSLE